MVIEREGREGHGTLVVGMTNVWKNKKAADWREDTCLGDKVEDD